MGLRVRSLAATTVLGLLVAGGCAVDEELPNSFAVTTAISVTPSDFLLGVPCSPGEGAMKSYVAVVTDRGPVDAAGNTPAGYAFDLPASPPVACTETVAFRYVVVGHRYEARVYAYDIEAGALTPAVAGCTNPATPAVVVPAPGSSQLCWAPGGAENGYQVAQPDWTRSCGAQGFGAAVARSAVEVRVGGCVAEGDNGNVGVGETAIVVDPLVGVAAPLSCLPPPDPKVPHVPEPEEIDAFDIIPDDAALPDQLGVDCNSAAPALARYTEVEPGVTYGFRVEAGNSEAPARWATHCEALAFQGVTVTANCGPLTDHGTIDLQIADCPAGATYHVRATNAETGAVLTLGDGQCPAQPADVAVPAGRYNVVVTVETADAEPNELSCDVTVVAASTSAVECPGPTPGAGD